MNTKKFSEAMGEIDDKYVDEAISYNVGTLPKKGRNTKRTIILIAAIIATLSLCGFAAYELGVFDPWFQKPSDNPIETVQSAIVRQLDKEYTVNVGIEEIAIDETETTRIIAMYSGSELAQARGWTDDYLAKHFIVVKAIYYVEYDHTKTFLDDGYTEQYFYLAENTESGKWEIIDNTAPHIVSE